MSADLALLADPDAELKLLRQLAAESYRAGLDDGRRAGIADTDRLVQAAPGTAPSPTHSSSSTAAMSAADPAGAPGTATAAPGARTATAGRSARPHSDDFIGRDA